MTRLILMRHAKSSWKDATQTDHQRPLNGRGRDDAPYMARLLAEKGWAPDLALVSDAARTEETWAWMAGEFESEPSALLLPALYHGGLRDIRRALEDRVRSESTVLVLGHNPGWEEAVELLTGRAVTMKTANAALLSHKLGWADAVGRLDWRLHTILTPKGRPTR
ncbi:MAG: histidine phosphatase family protein [Alphaproteobacteria bacterium]|nr:histidine phosphatase family protein [Alphaproteobacteria bacterium]MCB9690462.1 histidine phosphatase family protein [Alphaproteobacteria bacterium]